MEPLAQEETKHYTCVHSFKMFFHYFSLSFPFTRCHHSYCMCYGAKHSEQTPLCDWKSTHSIFSAIPRNLFHSININSVRKRRFSIWQRLFHCGACDSHVTLLTSPRLHEPAPGMVLCAATHSVWDHLCALHHLWAGETNTCVDRFQGHL